MEAGKVGITRRDARQMLDLYGVTGEEREELLTLASQSRQRGVWHTWWDVVPQSFYSYLGLESSASWIRVFENSYIPGLLQTESYARAVVDAVGPERSEADRDRFVALRKIRAQPLTTTHPPTLQALMDEAAISRIVGNPTVMTEQITQPGSMTHTVQSMDLHLVRQGQDGRDVFLWEQTPATGSPYNSSTGL
jgi:hypothetical protein